MNHKNTLIGDKVKTNWGETVIISRVYGKKKMVFTNKGNFQFSQLNWKTLQTAAWKLV